jgi:hypothetical protein
VLELPMNNGRIVPHPAIKNDPCAILTAARQGLLPLGTKRQRRIAYLAPSASEYTMQKGKRSNASRRGL